MNELNPSSMAQRPLEHFPWRELFQAARPTPSGKSLSACRALHNLANVARSERNKDGTQGNAMAEDLHKGRCLCGAVTIEAAGPPNWTATCHCADCRRATGAAMSAFAGFDSEKVTISGTSFREYESSPGVFRGFCESCGARLTYRSAKWPDELHLHVGVFDDANNFAPRGNVFTKEKLEWVVLEPDLPAYRTVASDES
jgi:hypothetical protein